MRLYAYNFANIFTICWGVLYRLSDGLHGHVTSMDEIVADFDDCFSQQRSREEFRHLPFFLYGESMGGAVVFNLCTRSSLSSIVRGAMLIAPMVDISDEMKLPAPVVTILRTMAHYFPLAPITPIPDISDRCFRDWAALMRCQADPLSYKGMPRLGAALAMLLATEDISKRLHELTTPVLIAHGDKDVVTCPKISESLFNSCQVSLPIPPARC
jgi:alpha-beta hydrolase superfamily lysophospholipase